MSKICPYDPMSEMSKTRSLHRLCADYDRLGNSSFLVDYRALDRWQLRAERVMEGCFAPATADGRLRTALCRCLTCYFYQPFPDREDPWFAYLMAAADAWAAAFSPADGWQDLPLDEALERIEVMNRISYMLLDHSRDAVIRRAYGHYARRVDSLGRMPAAVRKHWQTLCAEGNAIPLDKETVMEQD